MTFPYTGNIWAGRISKQGSFEGTEEEVGKGKGKLFRGNSKNYVVLSHHPAVNNEGNAIQSGIWVECHDTSRNTRKFS